MRPQTYRVELKEEDRVRLLLLIRQGQAPARVIRRAHTLLRASEGAFDHQIASALHVNRTTVQRTRERFAERGSRRRCTRRLARARSGSWTARPRRFWSRWPAAKLPRGGSTGACRCWPTVWSSWA